MILIDFIISIHNIRGFTPNYCKISDYILCSLPSFHLFCLDSGLCLLLLRFFVFPSHLHFLFIVNMSAMWYNTFLMGPWLPVICYCCAASSWHCIWYCHCIWYFCHGLFSSLSCSFCVLIWGMMLLDVLGAILLILIIVVKSGMIHELYHMKQYDQGHFDTDSAPYHEVKYCMIRTLYRTIRYYIGLYVVSCDTILIF